MARRSPLRAAVAVIALMSLHPLNAREVIMASSRLQMASSINHGRCDLTRNPRRGRSVHTQEMSYGQKRLWIASRNDVVKAQEARGQSRNKVREEDWILQQIRSSFGFSALTSSERKKEKGWCAHETSFKTVYVTAGCKVCAPAFFGAFSSHFNQMLPVVVEGQNLRYLQ